MCSFFKRIITCLLLCLYPYQNSIALDSSSETLNPNNSNSLVQKYDINNTNNLPPPETSSTSSNDPLTALQTLGLTNPHYDFGPLSIGGWYDTLLGTIFDAHYAQKLSPDWAIGLLGEYGVHQYRLSGTLGHQLWTDGEVKFTGEYLSQVLPFNFDSGNIDQRVNQTAYGLQLQQNFHGTAFQDVNLGGYWSNTPNVGLDDIIFLDNDLYYTNQRNIAGATTQGVDIGTDIILTSMTGLNAKVFYDNVNYATDLTGDTSENTFGAGGSLELNQIINDRMKFSVKSEFRAIYNTYGGSFSWSPNNFQPLGLHFSIFGEHLISHNQTPDSNSFGLEVGFLGDDNAGSPHYALDTSSALTDLESWVKNPAVYMERVLAISEQKTTLNAPMIGSITPNSGPFVGGNIITITGTNFLPGVTVTFNNEPAETTLISSTQLSVVVPALTLMMATAPGATETITQPVTIIVTNPNGQQTVYNNAYTYTTEFSPTLSGISPTSGSPSGGTSITLTGTNLTGTTSVTFDNIDASNINVVNDSTVTAITPAHASGTVDVALTTSNGLAILPAAYTYSAPPSISSVNPSSGSTTGGQNVTITGTNFTSASAVTFGGTTASFTIDSSTQITATTPAHVAGTVDVVVTTSDGSATAANAYTYNDPPTITTVNPASGSSTGGQSVTITGTNFTSASAVTFGGTNASFTVDSSTQITATTPAHVAGAVDVVVTTPDGSATAVNAYTYNDPPTITTVNPASGSSTGGQSVTITGTNFTSASAVTFGGTTASFTIDSSTQITATTPAHVAGAVDVVVTTPDGSATAANAYTYNDPPTITTVNPASGSTTGGQSVTITGTNFTSASAVTFGGTNASFTIDSSTQITATTPAHVAGTVDVVVTTPDSSATASNAYTYNDPPTITTVNPASGSSTGGQSVTITGTNFTSASAVTFGGTTASFTIDSSTQITATTPAHVAGTVDVVVTTSDGSATASNAYTYNGPPTITTVNPASGSSTGGQSVTITGTDFTSTSAVTFGGTNASFTIDSNTQITAITPPHSTGSVDVVVTTPEGSATAVNAYTYGVPIIFVTSAASTGNLGGFSGADAKCNASSSGKPTTGFAANYTYKALLNGNNATISGVRYYRTNGTTQIAVATGGNLVGENSLLSSINTTTNPIWTGARGINCNNWEGGSQGDVGTSSTSTSQYWYRLSGGGSPISCGSTARLYCVSQ